MNTYLTPKCDKKSRDWLILSAMGLLLYGGITVLIDMLTAREWSNAGVDALLVGLFLWPIVRILLRWRHRKKARQIALRVSGMTEIELPFHQADSVLNMPRAAETIQMLIAKGYLKGMSVDGKRGCVVLDAAAHKAKQIKRIKVICPHCGAENLMQRGRVGRCDYCNSELVDTKAQ